MSKYYFEESTTIFLMFLGIILGGVVGEHFTDVQQFLVTEDIILYTESSTNVYFSDNLKQSLLVLWNETGALEYGVCIVGEVYQNESNPHQLIYNLTNYAKKELGTTSSVSSGECTDKNEIGFLHKHPNSKCKTQISTVDMVSAKAKYSRGEYLFLIQCEYDKVEVYQRPAVEGFVLRLK